MLVLSRKDQENIVIPALGITITVVGIQPGKVRLGIVAPSDVAIYREEVWAKIQDREYLPELVGESVAALAHP